MSCWKLTERRYATQAEMKAIGPSPDIPEVPSVLMNWTPKFSAGRVQCLRNMSVSTVNADSALHRWYKVTASPIRDPSTSYQ